MRLLVIGATGRVGSHVVRQALDAGHDVTGLARNPATIADERHDRLQIAQGDVLDRASIVRALHGADAVISCLGTRDRKQRSLRFDGTRNIVTAMQSVGTRRLIVFSAFGVADSRAQLRRTSFFFGRVILPLLLERQFEDMARMEAVVRASDRDWVIVRPTGLTERPATGAVKVTNDVGSGAGTSIPMADVAAFMLQCAAADTWLGASPVIYA